MYQIRAAVPASVTLRRRNCYLTMPRRAADRRPPNPTVRLVASC